MKKPTKGSDPPKKTQLEPNLTPNFGNLEAIPIVDYTFPIKIESAQNNSSHWAARMAKKKKLQTQLHYFWKSENPPHIKPMSTILLTRIAPRFYDDDNLATNYKIFRDFLADLLYPGLAPGRADAFFQWKYNQQKGKTREYAVNIKIYEN